MSQKQKQSGGNRKGGRNKKWCEAYRAMGTRERNKKLKMASHIKRFPADKQAKNRMKSIANAALKRLREAA